MKTKLKKRLRELLVEKSTEADQRFSIDTSFVDHTNLVAVRRASAPEQWQFVALAFSPASDRFFLEVALARSDHYPLNHFPMDPNDPPVNGTTRFRAFRLWSPRNVSGGWLIQKATDEPANDTIAPPEGVFETPEAAMADVKERIVKWIMPYLVAASRSHGPKG
jgi:hypothetical protein